MKNHRFLWLRNRTTDNRKCEKARNIKEKRTIEMFKRKASGSGTDSMDLSAAGRTKNFAAGKKLQHF